MALLIDASLAVYPRPYPPVQGPLSIPGSYHQSYYSQVSSAVVTGPLSTPIDFYLPGNHFHEIGFDFSKFEFDNNFRYQFQVHVTIETDYTTTVWMDLIAPFRDPHQGYQLEYQRLRTFGLSATESFVDTFHKSKGFVIAERSLGKSSTSLKMDHKRSPFSRYREN